jgi:hypothetical protein
MGGADCTGVGVGVGGVAAAGGGVVAGVSYEENPTKSW